MFDEVCAAKTGRPPWLRPWGISVSAAAHVMVAAGIASIPPRPVEKPRSVEVATFLVLFQADRAPTLPSREHAGSGKAVTPALREPDAGSGDEGGKPRLAVDLRLAAPAGATDPSALPEIAPVAHLATPEEDHRSLLLLGGAMARDVETARLLAAARLGAGGTATAGPESDNAGSSVVAAEMLAELPRMLNQREITRRLRYLYPYRLRNQGVQGEVAVTFIIGLDGRVERTSIQVITATHPDLVQPTLRAIQLMRFRPARLHGEPVRVRATLPVRWELRDS